MLSRVVSTAGAESKQKSGGALLVGDKLFEAIMQHAKNNTELRAMVYYYVMLLSPKAPREWMGALRTPLQKRGSTTTWNDKSDPLYDLVQDSNTCTSDLSNYPTNKAHMWVKSLGVTDLKLDVAFGTFAGYGGDKNPSTLGSNGLTD